MTRIDCNKSRNTLEINDQGKKKESYIEAFSDFSVICVDLIFMLQANNKQIG